MLWVNGAGVLVLPGAAQLVLCAGASAEPGMCGARGPRKYLGLASEEAAARAEGRAIPVVPDKVNFFSV